MSTHRISFDTYAMALAEVASLRSEDPYRKVGAAAFDITNRVIATAYNGLQAGVDAPDGFWDDRDARQKYMLHAEANLCSLFKRGDVHTVAVTTLPCTSCMQLLCAHSIKRIIYGEDYAGATREVAKMYNIELIYVPRSIVKLNTYEIPEK